MKVLVTAASKHGATAEMAGWIGATLRESGLDVDVRRPQDVASLDGIDAVVLGSAVYAGRWLSPATKLVERVGPQFKARQTWLFSSGPAGDPPQPDTDPVDVESMRAATSARDHRVFAGLIDRSKLGFAEWAIVAALRVPNGDYRERPEVEAWAREIATALTAPPTAVG
jgi:menaquinone-dependent protoporphyrinogen oxidase